MKKSLVAYFSCTGTTERAASRLAELIGADLYEIVPAQPYSAADLDWTNKHSRSSVEMSDADSRPQIKGVVEDMQQYQTIFVGFPIWWYVAPHIINTFLESYNFSGKTIVLFATSGGSGMGKTESVLKPCCADDVTWGKGLMIKNGSSDGTLLSWAKQYI